MGSTETRTSANAKALPETVELTRSDFESAVKAALKEIDRPDLLVDSPLVQTRRVLERCNATANPLQRSNALADLIREQCDMFLESPRDRDLFRVLQRTYLEPAVKQRAAADDLQMPWGTYRRYLRHALRRLIDALWHRETLG